MIRVVGITFKEVGKIYWFSPGPYKLEKGEKVVVETVRGLELGFVTVPPQDIEDGVLEHELKPVVRIASKIDNKNYSENITLESVARASYLSVNQLCRLFSEHCGTTVAKYITSKRITEAKKMLAAGKNVTEVAMLCGFGDYSGFIRVFKKNVGVTPGKYRSSEENWYSVNIVTKGITYEN